MKKKATLLASILMLSVSMMAQQKTYTKAEIDASNTIKFCNSVIELSNMNRGTTSNYESMLSTAKSNIDKLKRNPNVQTMFVNYKNFRDSFGNLTDYQAAYKTAPTFTEKEDINNAVITATKDIDNAVKWATDISKYFSEKEFLSDTDFAKYPVMKDSLTFYFEKGYNGWATASKLSSIAGNKAELVLLQKSKIADFIIPMKSDLNGLESILSSFNSDKIDHAEVKSQLAAVTESINKNKDISTKDVKKLSDIYYKEVYQTFYSKAEQMLDILNKFTLELETNPQSDRLKGMYSSAISNYRATVENYNTFISQK